MLGSPYRTSHPYRRPAAVFASPPPLRPVHPHEGRKLVLRMPVWKLTARSLALFALPIWLVIHAISTDQGWLALMVGAVGAVKLCFYLCAVSEVSHRIHLLVREGTVVVMSNGVTRQLPIADISVHTEPDGAVVLDREGWVRVEAGAFPQRQRRALYALLHELTTTTPTPQTN